MGPPARTRLRGPSHTVDTTFFWWPHGGAIFLPALKSVRRCDHRHGEGDDDDGALSSEEHIEDIEQGEEDDEDDDEEDENDDLDDAAESNDFDDDEEGEEEGEEGEEGEEDEDEKDE